MTSSRIPEERERGRGGEGERERVCRIY